MSIITSSSISCSTWMGDRLQTGKPFRYVTIHAG